MTSRTDFDLHGIVGIRVIDASGRELNAIRRQLGAIERPLDREPDVLIRFVARASNRSGMRHVTLGETAALDDTFVALRGRAGVPTRVTMPLDRIGAGMELVCDRGTIGIPHLISLVNVTSLAKGILPLHASAFVHDGLGVLVTGWAKGGKTEVILGMMGRGAQHVGDEWIYVDPVTRRMHGIREPMRIWDWQLRQLPVYRERAPRRSIVRLDLLRPIVHAISELEDAVGRRPGVLPAAVRKIAPFARRRLSIQVPPEQLFGRPPEVSAPIDVVVMVENHSLAGIDVEPVPSRHVAERMIHSLAYERLELTALYHQFRFAFPDRTSEVLDNASAVERDLLGHALDGVPALSIRHPYPVSIEQLAATVESAIAASATR